MNAVTHRLYRSHQRTLACAAASALRVASCGHCTDGRARSATQGVTGRTSGHCARYPTSHGTRHGARHATRCPARPARHASARQASHVQAAAV